MARSRSRAERRLTQLLMDRHPGEVAQLLEEAPAAESASLLEQEAPRRIAEILACMSPDLARRIVERLGDDATRGALSSLESQRAASLLARMDDSVREAHLALLEPAVAEELRALAAYPPDTAGGLMDPAATAFPARSRVSTVTQRLRELRRKRIQDVFLLDEAGRLVGTVPLQDLVLARPGETLASLVHSAPHSVPLTATKVDVLEQLERRPGASLGVVDYDGRLVGVLRQDELVTAAQEVATAELVTMVGAGREERALSSPLLAVRKRLPWLEINLGTAFLAASVVGLFEETIARNTALAVLLPVVAGQSGNTGAQALAVTMRGLALREVRARHWMRVAIKEVAVALINGVAVAVTTATAVFFWSDSSGLALVIGVSMVMSMVAAGLAGAVIPMALTSLGQDPAQSSSIILTTVTDVAGFFSFLGIATALSSML